MYVIFKRMVKLLSIKKSIKKDKKLMATFELDDSRFKTTHFGATGYDDYIKTKDKEQREDYWARHVKDMDTDDPTRAGYLSLFILWNKPTLKASVADYERRLKNDNWVLPDFML